MVEAVMKSTVCRIRRQELEREEICLEKDRVTDKDEIFGKAIW